MWKKPSVKLVLPRAAAAVERARFDALGTQCEIQFVAPDVRTGKAFVRAATAWVNAFEAKYSRFRSDSVIGRINAAAGREWVAVDAETEGIFALAEQVHILTNGLLDATALPLMRLWNYRSPKPEVPAADHVRATLSKVGWQKFLRQPGRVFLPEVGMGLDLGGFGKEYAVDRVADIAVTHGVRNVLIDFGHDVRALGAPPDAPCWIVGVEDPKKPGSTLSRLAVDNHGIATSGDYVRFVDIGGRRVGHIIDPRTGYPVAHGTRSVTVVANTCLEAGLLSTAAFVLGGEEGLRLIDDFSGAEGCIQGSDRDYQTRSFYRYVA